MASHDVSWVPGAHMRFENLDFIVTMEGELVRAPIVVQLLHSTGLNAITEVLGELQLHASEAYVPRSNRLLSFDYGRLEH